MYNKCRLLNPINFLFLFLIKHTPNDKVYVFNVSCFFGGGGKFIIIVDSVIAWGRSSSFNSVRSFGESHYNNITVGSWDAGLFAYRRQLFLDVSLLTVQGLDLFLQLLARHLTQLQSLVQAYTNRKSKNIVEVKKISQYACTKIKDRSPTDG